jgi:hypothetical protein
VACRLRQSALVFINILIERGLPVRRFQQARCSFGHAVWVCLGDWLAAAPTESSLRQGFRAASFTGYISLHIKLQ